MTTVVTQEQGYTGLSLKIPRIVTQSTLSQVTTAGWYNNNQVASGQPALNPQDLVAICYSYGTSSQATAMFAVSIGANGVVTLSLDAGSGIVLPTIANHIATYTNTSGGLSEDPATAISGGNIQAGLSGTAGYFVSFPSTAASGSFQFKAANSAGNYAAIFTHASLGQASTWTLADPGAAASKVIQAAGSLVSGNFLQNSGTAGLAVDSGLSVTNVVSKAAANTFTGSGSIILPKNNGTESSNAVTANGVAGVITTSSLTTAAGSSYSITWTNSAITATSVVLLTVSGGTNTRETLFITCAPGSSTATIVINNIGPTNALNGTLLISYLVI